MLGAALGASIGVPAGMLQDYLITMLPEDQQRQRQLRVQQTESIIAGEGKKRLRGAFILSFFLSFFDLSTKSLLFTLPKFIDIPFYSPFRTA